MAKKNFSKEEVKQYHENKENEALETFAQMMIEKIESIQQDWRKPWFADCVMGWNRNLSGRAYNGINQLMLSLLCEKKGYRVPIFVTYDRVNQMNYKKNKEGKSVAATDSDGNKLPIVHINKGEKSFPVFITVINVVNEKKERISYDEYCSLPEKERDKWKKYPSMKVYSVWNIQQTNIREARPELYAKLVPEHKERDTSKDLVFTPVDKMISDGGWICPIIPTYGDEAYYSISKKEIVIPEKKQFIDGESFYSNLFHEMAHSTGAEDQLDRLKPSSFGSAEYAREELVAELSAAVCANRYGMQKNLKNDSAAYLKSWLNKLKEDPKFIKTILLDVKRASAMIIKECEKIAA